MSAYLQGAVVPLHVLLGVDHAVDEGQVHVHGLGSGLLLLGTLDGSGVLQGGRGRGRGGYNSSGGIVD